MDLDFETLYTGIINYVQNNTPVALVLSGVLLLLLFKKPGLFFILVFIIAVNIASLYLISGISSAGGGQKEKLVRKSEKQMITR